MNNPTNALPQDEQQIQDVVREKYARIAANPKASGCCGTSNGQTASPDYTVFSESYQGLEGYAPDADLGLGCGLPTEHALIKPGHTVVDLGSGAGNDCFVARAEAGPEGRVIGIDITPEMIEKARHNAARLGFKNVEFRLGQIEAIPLENDTADVVVSNCVLNLVPVKEKAFAEMFRILRPGGHFSVSDVVLRGQLPERLRHQAEMYAGCVSGAMQQPEYLAGLHRAGFQNVRIQKQRPIAVPEEILRQYLSSQELESFRQGGAGIFSVTVYGEKPLDAACCDPQSCC